MVSVPRFRASRALEAARGVVDEGDGTLVHVRGRRDGNQVSNHDAQLVWKRKIVVQAWDGPHRGAFGVGGKVRQSLDQRKDAVGAGALTIATRIGTIRAD